MSMQAMSLVLGVCAALGTCGGILLILYKKDWALKNSHQLNSFAAGIILAVAFFHLLPESMEITKDKAIFFVFGGFVVFYLLETVIILHSSAQIHYSESLIKKSYKGPVIFSGLLFHSFIDGIVIGAGFEVDMKLGLFASASVIAHEVPEGIASLSLLMRSMSMKRALAMSLAVAWATPAGVLMMVLLLKSVSPVFLGCTLAVAAGSFFYIGASDLVPETHEEHAGLNALVLITGALLVLLMGVVFE